MATMQVLNEQGDTKIEWDPADEESVKTARVQWDTLEKEGYEFYEVVDAKGKKVEAFDPGLTAVIAAPGARERQDVRGGRRERAMSGGPVASRR